MLESVVTGPVLLLPASSYRLLDSVAGNPVVAANVPPLGVLLAADLDGDRTAGVEAAAGGRVHRRGHVAGEDDALALALHARVRDRHGREQRLGVGMGRVQVELVAAGQQ